MKKVFKASILAASVAFAFAANAATVTSTPIQLSKQGLAAGLDYTGDFSFDVVVTKEHASSSQIVLTLSDKVDLTGVLGGACVNNVGAGTGDCGDILFNYGTGSFTFDTVTVDEDDNTITFKVNLGNPLTANSAFRVTVGDVNLPTVSGASTVAYASNLAGTAIETGTGTVATEVDQFSATVTTKLDGIIERADRKSFVRNFDTTNQDDGLVVTFADLTADVVNPAAINETNGVKVVLKGDFSDTTTHVAAAWTASGQAAATAVTTTALTFAYTEAEWNALIAGTGETEILFTKQAAGHIIEASNFTVDVTAAYDETPGAGGTSKSVTLASAAAAGEWELDAAVINVPYLPINYGLSSNIEVANHGDTAAEIMAEGFDQTGKVYAPVVVKTVAKKTMGKISENDLKAAFGITDAQVKLNVTFVIDQDADKVTLVPYYKEGQSRINVMSDQYKADDIR